MRLFSYRPRLTFLSEENNVGNNEAALLQIIAAEVAAMRIEISDLRVKDLPALQTSVALVQDRATRSAKLISAIGAAITLVLSLLLAFVKAPR
jgi:hypothetical protein